MRPFWQSIAFLLLVLFVPASVHCMPGQSLESHSCSLWHTSFSGDDNIASGSTLPIQENHVSCPAHSLSHTQLPARLKVAVSLKVNPDKGTPLSLSGLLAVLVYLSLAHQGLSDLAAVSPAPAPVGLSAGWAFAVRAALPARWPSDLV
ncbi:MAG: hypothetical protein ACAI35_07460 [Candidatus Methylacidiphilales bacterium]